MTWARRNKERRQQRGYTLLELMVGIIIGSFILTALTGMQERIMTRSVSRMKVDMEYQQQVGSVARLFKVAQAFRYGVYASKSDALTGDTNLIVAHGSAVRFERKDGNGFFILWWDTTDHRIYVGAGSGTSSTRWEGAIASGIYEGSFDASAGYLVAFLSREVSVQGFSDRGRAMLRTTRNSANGTPLVEYLIRMEPTL